MSIDLSVPDDGHVAPNAPDDGPRSPSRASEHGGGIFDGGFSDELPGTPGVPDPPPLIGRGRAGSCSDRASPAASASEGEPREGRPDSGGGGSSSSGAGSPSAAEAAFKTIQVEWEEPDSQAREAGVFGALAFKIWLPVVNIKAHLKTGRFWSDSSLLKLGRFSDVAVRFESGRVHAIIRVTFERDGLYFAITQV